MVSTDIPAPEEIKDGIAEALKTAFYIGLSPDLFWCITPWQFGVCISAYNEKIEFRHNQDAFMMWNNAVLQRWGGKRAPPFPALNQFTTGYKKQVNWIDEAAIIERMKAHNNSLKE